MYLFLIVRLLPVVSVPKGTEGLLHNKKVELS
jgi:hypothetical protein